MMRKFCRIVPRYTTIGGGETQLNHLTDNKPLQQLDMLKITEINERKYQTSKSIAGWFNFFSKRIADNNIIVYLKVDRCGFVCL